ncbi:MAG: hypothetical protein IJC35_00980 [Oscillospiraceae bacterium]|nr:hypothetical protein [Oscillospiraceae bacterium]
MKRVLCLLLALVALCLSGCESDTVDAAEVAVIAERAVDILEEEGYKVTHITDAAYLLELTANMNASGYVDVKNPMAAYIEATNAVSAGDDAIEIYAFTSRKDAENVAEYLVNAYLDQKYQVYRSETIVCIGTLDAINTLK